MSGKRILVVDDEPQIQRFLTPALLASGYEVTNATTAAEALRKIATEAPDAVVLDLGLPDRDGKDVIREVRGWSRVPIIVLSARDRETEKSQPLTSVLTTMSKSPLASGNSWRDCAPHCAGLCARRARRHVSRLGRSSSIR